MDNKYKISVIVPCLNAGATIANCINSILMQEYSNFEIIVVDGLSNDETINIVNRLISDGDHKIIAEKDNGIYDAINKGIDMASGDYLIVLGSDDVFYDNKVLNRVFLSDFKYADLIYGNVIFKSTNVIYDGKFNIIKLMTKNICHQSIFYHKSVYEKLGKYDTKYKALADVLFNIRCFESGDITIRYIDEIISIYNDKGYSSMHSDTAYWENLTENLKKYCSEDVLNYQTTTRKITNLNRALAQRDALLSERNVAVLERDGQIENLNETLSELDSQVVGLKQVLDVIMTSRSWKLTAPLRYVSSHLNILRQKSEERLRKKVTTRESSWLTIISKKEKKLTRVKKHNYEYDFDLSRDSAAAKVVRMVGHNKHVLEIGAGPGSITKILKQNNGCSVTGVENDYSAIEKLSEFCEAVYQCDLNASEWTSKLSGCGTFDVIVAADVLEHLYKPQETLAALKPFFSPGGYLVISLPHLGNNAVIASILAGDFEYRDFGLLDRTHIRFFAIKNMQQLIENSGYKILEAEFVINHPEQTELALHWGKLPAGIKTALADNRYGSVYQVVMKIVPASAVSPGTHLADISVPTNFTTSEESFKTRLKPYLSSSVRYFLRRVWRHTFHLITYDQFKKMNIFFNNYLMIFKKWLSRIKYFISANTSKLSGKYLFYENENTLNVNNIRFFLTWDIKELLGMDSSDNYFILGKTPQMVEFYLSIKQKQNVKKIFDMGIFKGGSVVLYDQLFRPDKIVAIDFMLPPVEALTNYINQSIKNTTVKPYYGINQADRQAMEAILSFEFPRKDIDLIVDDASHFYAETREAFNINFPYLKAGGSYIIEDWGWAHWTHEPWQTEASPFGNSKAMSNLLIELFMFTASRPDLVEDISFNHNTIILKKGSGQLPAGKFDIGEHYQLRGKSFEAWL